MECPRLRKSLQTISAASLLPSSSLKERLARYRQIKLSWSGGNPGGRTLALAISRQSPVCASAGPVVQFINNRPIPAGSSVKPTNSHRQASFLIEPNLLDGNRPRELGELLVFLGYPVRTDSAESPAATYVTLMSVWENRVSRDYPAEAKVWLFRLGISLPQL